MRLSPQHPQWWCCNRARHPHRVELILARWSSRACTAAAHIGLNGIGQCRMKLRSLALFECTQQLFSGCGGLCGSELRAGEFLGMPRQSDGQGCGKGKSQQGSGQLHRTNLQSRCSLPESNGISCRMESASCSVSVTTRCSWLGGPQLTPGRPGLTPMAGQAAAAIDRRRHPLLEPGEHGLENKAMALRLHGRFTKHP